MSGHRTRLSTFSSASYASKWGDTVLKQKLREQSDLGREKEEEKRRVAFGLEAKRFDLSSTQNSPQKSQDMSPAEDELVNVAESDPKI